MSGSRTAVPITPGGQPTSPLSTFTSESATRSSQASDDDKVTQDRWWSEEDLKGAAAERSRSQQDRATQGRQLSLDTQPKPKLMSSSSRPTPGLRPTASLFTPASSLPAKRASGLNSSIPDPLSIEEGFHYNLEEYRRSSPDKFVYPTGSTEPPLGADLEHPGPSSGSGTGVGTSKLDSPVLPPEEKAKIAQLASRPKATKAVPIKAPASATLKAPAAAEATSTRHGASSEPIPDPYDLNAKSWLHTPNLPLPASRPPSSMTSGSAAFLTEQTSPNNSHTSLTSSIRSTRSGSSFSASLVPYEGSSEEDATSSEAEKESATPIADVSLELPTTPPEESVAVAEPEKPEPKAESDVSLEDQIRPAMAVSDVEPENESEGLSGALAQSPNQAAANAEPLGDGDKHESTTRPLTAIPSGSGDSPQGVTSEASVLQNASEGVPSETEKVPSSALPYSPSTVSEIPATDAAVAPTLATDKVETIGSEAVQRNLPADDSRAPPPSPTSTFSDMPAFNFDQRIRSFNPFAAPFVPPTAHQPGSSMQSIASGIAAPGLVPPSAGIGQAYTLGPFGPVAPITAKPMGPADIQCQTLGNLLRQAMDENGVLHHKIAKYDHGLKAEQERRATIVRELDEFKAEHNRVLRNGKPTPIQQRQVVDLEATIARGNGELERLRRELHAMGMSLARVQKEHAASMKREKDTFTSEQRKWEVAVKMRDERIEALQQQHQADEQKLETMRAEHEAEAARLKDDLESEWEKRANARDSTTDATRERLEQTVASQEAVESKLRDAEAEYEQLSLDRDKLRDELDNVKHRHETLSRLHEGQKDVLETQSKKLKEAVAQQELLRTSLTVCQDELATSRQEEKKVRETRDRFGTMLKSTSQEKTEIERKFRAELDKVQREKADVEAKLNAELDKLVEELGLLKKDLTDAVREIVHVEGERDKSDTIAVDSFEYALSGMQSLRRLLNEEQRHSSDLEADYDKLKTACSARIEQLEQLLKARDAELEYAKKAKGDEAADNAAKEGRPATKALLKDLEDERTRLKLQHNDDLEQRRKLETQLEAERAGHERLDRDVERLQKLADQHKTAEVAALETSHHLKKRVSDLEDRQTTLGSLLVEAKAERDAFSKAEAQLQAERAGNDQLRSDVQTLQKLADQHKGAQLAALEASSRLTKKVSDLEDRQTTLGGLLIGARAERDTASKQLEDSRREKARAEEEKADAERKIAMLEDKVESLASELEAAKAVASSITLDTKRPFASKVKQIAALRGAT